jgi:F-type H+-transporting ATPase subunit alpha
MDNSEHNVYGTVSEQTAEAMQTARDSYEPALEVRDVGTVVWVGQGVARVKGLPGVQSEELIRFPGDIMGMAFNLEPEQIAVVLFEKGEHIRAGSEVERTGRITEVPVGEAVLGRVINPLGRPLDGQGNLAEEERRPVERAAPGITDRLPVTQPLQSGITSVDALIPIGRGQRELILGDRQTGKSAIALDTIINQRNTGVYCIYCAVGQRASMVARLVADLKKYEVMDKSAVIVATGEDAPGLNYLAPYAATAMAEFFMDRGDDVLIVYDDLTNHARSYRELSLLLRRPPAREAYPGDIFYIHSRLLERSTHLNDDLGGGSMTALPIIETQAQNVSAYIPTNLISITDGQIYLSPQLFGEGVLPAVDVGRSVSRVGGKTQLPAYRAVAGDLRLSYSQFEELETFARFGTRLDEETRSALERGRRVREVLKQPQYQPIPVPEQIAVMLAVTEGLFDPVPIEKIPEAKERVRKVIRDEQPEIADRIMDGEKLSEDLRRTLVEGMKRELTGEGGLLEEESLSGEGER